MLWVPIGIASPQDMFWCQRKIKHYSQVVMEKLENSQYFGLQNNIILSAVHVLHRSLKR